MANLLPLFPPCTSATDQLVVIDGSEILRARESQSAVCGTSGSGAAGAAAGSSSSSGSSITIKQVTVGENPDHSPRTRNQADSPRPATHPRWSDPRSADLTTAKRVRDLIKNKTLQAAAAEVGLPLTTVWEIKTYFVNGGLGGGGRQYSSVGKKVGKLKLRGLEIARRRFEEGKFVFSIAKEMGLSRPKVHHAVEKYGEKYSSSSVVAGGAPSKTGGPGRGAFTVASGAASSAGTEGASSSAASSSAASSSAPAHLSKKPTRNKQKIFPPKAKKKAVVEVLAFQPVPIPSFAQQSYRAARGCIAEGCDFPWRVHDVEGALEDYEDLRLRVEVMRDELAADATTEPVCSLDAGAKRLRPIPGKFSNVIRIANNSPPPKVQVAHPHPIHPLSLFANSLSIPSNRGPLSVRRKQGYYSQTGLPDPPDGGGLL